MSWRISWRRREQGAGGSRRTVGSGAWPVLNSGSRAKRPVTAFRFPGVACGRGGRIPAPRVERSWNACGASAMSRPARSAAGSTIAGASRSATGSSKPSWGRDSPVPAAKRSSINRRLADRRSATSPRCDRGAPCAESQAPWAFCHRPRRRVPPAKPPRLAIGLS